MKPKYNWTEAQLSYLRTYYVSSGSATIAKQLGIGLSIVKHKAIQLGLISGRWYTREEEEWLRNNYHNTSRAELERHLGRKFVLISRKACQMGITKERRRSITKRRIVTPSVKIKKIPRLPTPKKESRKAQRPEGAPPKKQERRLPKRIHGAQVPLYINAKTTVLVPASYTDAQKQKVIKIYTRQ